MVVPRTTINLLASFLYGNIDLTAFERQLADRLFLLRQSPQVTREKRLLSAIQLRLHQISEGGDKFKVYMAVQNALNQLQPARLEAEADETSRTSLTTISDKPGLHSEPYQSNDPKLEGSITKATDLAVV